MGEPEDEAIAAVDRGFHDLPLHKHLGLRIVQQKPHIVVQMHLSDDVRGPGPGTIHGGILATIADVRCALALWGTYDSATEVPVTTDMHVRYYRQPRSSPVTAEAHVVQQGRRLLSVECSVKDAGDRQLVRATATYMVVAIGRS